MLQGCKQQQQYTLCNCLQYEEQSISLVDYSNNQDKFAVLINSASRQERAFEQKVCHHVYFNLSMIAYQVERLIEMSHLPNALQFMTCRCCCRSDWGRWNLAILWLSRLRIFLFVETLLMFKTTLRRNLALAPLLIPPLLLQLLIQSQLAKMRYVQMNYWTQRPALSTVQGILAHLP